MGKVRVQLTMSLDGFVAGPNDNEENGLGDGGAQLFEWYGNGEVEYKLPGLDMVCKVSRASASLLDETWRDFGAAITGRRTFDIAHGWGGNPPGGVTTFVVTHNVPQEWVKEDSPFVFVNEGVERAMELAQAAAGDKYVDLDSASIVQQCLVLGLLDQIQVDVVPLLLGGGVRLFDHIGGLVNLEQVKVIEGKQVTHLVYRVVK